LLLSTVTLEKKHTLIASIMYSCNCLQSSHRGVA